MLGTMPEGMRTAGRLYRKRVSEHILVWKIGGENGNSASPGVVIDTVLMLRLRCQACWHLQSLHRVSEKKKPNYSRNV